MKQVNDIREVVYTNRRIVKPLMINHSGGVTILYSQKGIKISEERYETMQELVLKGRLFKL